MKIAMVTTQFAEIGGVENVVRSLARELSENHQIYLITREREKNTDEFKGLFEEVYEIEGTEGYLEFLIKGRRFLERNQDSFDVFHFHNWSPILPAVGLDTPKILTYHGTTFDTAVSSKKYFLSAIYWLLEEAALFIPDKVTSITQSHLKPFFTSKDIEIIRNGVDTSLYRPSNEREKLRQKKGIESTGILIVGKHIEEKGHDRLIEAASHLNFRYKLMVPSTGPKTQDLKQKAKDLDVNAEFYGKVSENDLIELYQSADMFCLPSENEGLPLSMLEALSSGVPVSVSEVADNKQIIEESQAGKTFNPENTGEIVKSLQEIREEGSGMSEKARSYSVNNLDWKTIANRYIRIYEKMI